jgi:hypothetical protein
LDEIVEEHDDSLVGAVGSNGDMKAASKLRLFITYKPKLKLKFIISKKNLGLKNIIGSREEKFNLQNVKY